MLSPDCACAVPASVAGIVPRNIPAPPRIDQQRRREAALTGSLLLRPRNAVREAEPRRGVELARQLIGTHVELIEHRVVERRRAGVRRMLQAHAVDQLEIAVAAAATAEITAAAAPAAATAAAAATESTAATAAVRAPTRRGSRISRARLDAPCAVARHR